MGIQQGHTSTHDLLPFTRVSEHGESDRGDASGVCDIDTRIDILVSVTQLVHRTWNLNAAQHEECVANRDSVTRPNSEVRRGPDTPSTASGSLRHSR